MIPLDKAGKAGREDVLSVLYESPVKLTAQAFIREIRSRFGVSSRDAKKIINRLVNEQELSYHEMYGATYVEKSFLKPVQVTDHFVLSPPGFATPGDRGSHTIVIDPGISFGSGQHPTTRICLEAIDCCFYKKRIINRPASLMGADIGTGSGVLGMGLVLAGIGGCRAYEIDPVSVHEAKKNVAINELDSRMEIINGYISHAQEEYAVICANLRYPTLKKLSRLICSGLIPNGTAILSGFRPWEEAGLMACYRENGLTPVWQKTENNWSGILFIKESQ